MTYFTFVLFLVGFGFSNLASAEVYYVVPTYTVAPVYVQQPSYGMQTLQAAHRAELALAQLEAARAAQRVEQEYTQRILQDSLNRLNRMQNNYYQPGLPSNVSDLVGTPMTTYDEQIYQRNQGAIGPKGEYHQSTGQRQYTENAPSGRVQQTSGYERQRYRRRGR